jgi:glutamyl-tRNA reductase
VEGAREEPFADLFVVGVNHRTAGAGLRDRLFVEAGDQAALLAELRAAGLEEAILLSTCDRVEVVGAAAEPAAAGLRALALLSRRAGLPSSALDGQDYRAGGRAVAAHLFAVAASLESQVIGEPQVLGQVKESHRLAVAAGTSGPRTEALFQAAYKAAKRVRTETEIARQPTSIAASALLVARRIHGRLERCKAMLMGLGEMGELLAGELVEAGVDDLVVLHESERRAELVARRLGRHFRPWGDLAEALAEADIVVAAAGSGRYTVTAESARAALKRRRLRPIFFIDAAVPGDLDPAVAELDGAFVYDLAELEAVALEGRASRDTSTEAARAIIAEELAAFLRGREERPAAPALVELRRHFESLRGEVLGQSGLDAAEATRRLINRLLHGPSETLRRAAAEDTESRARLEAALRELFARTEESTSSDEEEEEDRA